MILDWLYSALILLAGYIVLGVTGFGSSLVVVPLLSRFWPLSDVVALAILLDVSASSFLLKINFEHLRWAEVFKLMPSMAIGMVFGILLLGEFDKKWPPLFLGIYIFVVGLRSYSRINPTNPVHPLWCHVAGLLIGIIEVMFATAGPVIVSWLRRQTDDVNSLRTTIAAILIVAGSIAIILLWTSERIYLGTTFYLWLAAIPVAIIGVAIGNKIAKRISPEVIKRLIATLLVISGLSMILGGVSPVVDG